MFPDPKPSAEEEDNANPNIYGNQLDKEALINSPGGDNSESREYLENEDKPYQENFDYHHYRDPEYPESDRDSYLERMSGSQAQRRKREFWDKF